MFDFLPTGQGRRVCRPSLFLSFRFLLVIVVSCAFSTNPIAIESGGTFFANVVTTQRTVSPVCAVRAFCATPVTDGHSFLTFLDKIGFHFVSPLSLAVIMAWMASAAPWAVSRPAWTSWM